MNPRRIKLVIKSDLQNVSLVGNAVNKICSLIPLSQIETYLTELCIVEACNNVIKHAYNAEPNHDVEVIVSLHMDKVIFEVCDDGQQMQHQPATALDFDPSDLENLPESGMGRFIINHVMQDVHYSSQNGKNILTLTKAL